MNSNPPEPEPLPPSAGEQACESPPAAADASALEQPPLSSQSPDGAAAGLLLSDRGLSQEERAEARAYGRAQLRASLADRAVDGLVLSLAAGVFARPLDAWLAGPVPNDWLRLPLLLAIITCVHELFSFPLAYYSGWVLERRHALSRQSAGRWVGRHLLQFLLTAGLNTALLCGLFALIRLTGDLWWLLAAGGFFVLGVLLGQLAPVLILPLFYKIEPIQDGLLRGRLERLAAGTGLSIEGVYRLVLSAETVKANAMLAGLGRTRRVLLGDTLLAAFSPEEIEVIFAHEVGHHVHRHLPKLLALGVVLSAGGFWACDFALRTWLGVDSTSSTPLPVSAVPLLMLCLWAFSLVIEPLQNAVSRHFERQSDRYALGRSGQPEAYRSAFRKLARLNKDDPDPHPLEVLLWHSHPPISQRLAIAE